MSGMRKTGMILMVMAVILNIVFQAVRYLTIINRNLYPRNLDGTLVSALLLVLEFAIPGILVLVLSWLWPRRGGAIATILSFCLMLLNTLGILFSVNWSALFGRPDRFFNSTLFEITEYVVPQIISFAGSLLAWLAVRKVDNVPSQNSAIPDVRKSPGMFKAGIIMVFLAVISQFLLGTVFLSLSGDSVLWMNIFQGIIWGSLYWGPTFLLAIVALKWPRQGGIIAIAGYSVLLMLLIALATVWGFGLPRYLWFIAVPASAVALIGSVLVLVSTLALRPDKSV